MELQQSALGQTKVAVVNLKIMIGKEALQTLHVVVAFHVLMKLAAQWCVVTVLQTATKHVMTLEIHQTATQTVHTEHVVMATSTTQQESSVMIKIQIRMMSVTTIVNIRFAEMER
jgi:hypothetical protein